MTFSSIFLLSRLSWFQSHDLLLLVTLNLFKEFKTISLICSAYGALTFCKINMYLDYKRGHLQWCFIWENISLTDQFFGGTISQPSLLFTFLNLYLCISNQELQPVLNLTSIASIPHPFEPLMTWFYPDTSLLSLGIKRTMPAVFSMTLFPLLQNSNRIQKKDRKDLKKFWVHKEYCNCLQYYQMEQWE